MPIISLWITRSTIILATLWALTGQLSSFGPAAGSDPAVAVVSRNDVKLGKLQDGKFTSNPNALQITTAPSLTVSPTGNPAASLATVSVQGMTGSSTMREFLVNLGMGSNQGASNPDRTARGKVTLYTGMDCYAGSGDCWSYNPLLNLRPGVPDSTTGQTVEIDLNNLNSHRGDEMGLSTLTAPVSYGLTISGAGFYRNTAAISITGSISNNTVTGPIWNSGISFPRDAIRQQTILDNSAAPIILKAFNTRAIGIDLSRASFTRAAALMPSNAPLSWIDRTSTPRQMIDGDGGGNLNLGRGATAVLSRVDLLPATDAKFSLGNPNSHWATTYTAAVTNSSSLTLAANGAGTVNLQAEHGVQVRILDTPETPTAYVSLTGSSGANGLAYTTISSASGTMSNIGLMLTGKGTNGVLSGVFTRAADPTTKDIPINTCADWNNTTAATYKHVCNFGGTLRSVIMQ